MAYTNEIGLMDFYKHYVTISKRRNKPYKDYQTFAKVIKTFNKKFRDRIIYNSERITMPYKLGDLYVKKFDTNRSPTDDKNWKINYKETRATGKVVYHEDDCGYKWQWTKVTCRVRGKRYFRFKPCRAASRMIADAVKNKNLDFYR